MRLVLVPLAMLSTPQQLAVLVNCWSLMSTSTGSSPAATPAGQDGLFKLGLAGMHFADLEGDVAAGLEDAVQFMEDLGHRGLPGVELLGDGELYGFGVDAKEPAAQPVVGGVIHDVEERAAR